MITCFIRYEIDPFKIDAGSQSITRPETAMRI